MEEEFRKHSWTIIEAEVLVNYNDGKPMKNKNNNNKLFLLLRVHRIVLE